VVDLSRERLPSAKCNVLAMHPAIELRTVGVTRAGDLAMLHGKWILYESGSDGSQIRREGQTTETARLQPDGS
jgi:hypothetical protein